ncbi:Belongs to the cd36 [Sparganum proliferum]
MMRKQSKKCLIIIAICAIICAVLTSAFLWILLNFESIVDKKLAQSISITPGSAVYSNWVCPDTPVMFSIYLFNITNRDEIFAGMKPRVQEIGPYVYREKREKTNIKFAGEDDYSNVTFNLRITYFLDRDLSAGDPDKDTIVGLSIPFVAMSAGMDAGTGPTETEYSFLSLFASPKLFVKTTVNKYLWGYVDDILDACNSFTPDKCQTNKVGIMFGKNGTDSGPFTIDTGVNDISQVGRILTYQGKSTVDVWSSAEASMINGTDGSQLAPGLKHDSTRYIFAHDLCRSFLLEVKGPGKLTNSEDLKVYLIGGTPQTALPASQYPYNEGFCAPKTPGPKCPPQGLFDLSSCRAQGDTRPPIYSSQPRFFGADPSLREGIDGMLEPTTENSETKVYVEPKTGLVLEAYKRLQVSVYVRQAKGMSDNFKNFTKPVFFPLAWFEESAVADAASLNMLYKNLYVMPKVMNIVLLVLFGLFLALFVALLLVLIVQAFLFCCTPRRPAGKAAAGVSWVADDVRYQPVSKGASQGMPLNEGGSAKV